MEYIRIESEYYSSYDKEQTKNRAINNAILACQRTGKIYYVLKTVATITPKGVTVDDYEKEEE